MANILGLAGSIMSQLANINRAKGTLRGLRQGTATLSHGMRSSDINGNLLRATQTLDNKLLPEASRVDIAGELDNARNRTQAALNNIGNINARNAQVVSDISKYQNRIDGFGNLTPRGQILNLQSPAVERYPILQPGIVQQNGIIKPSSGTVRSVTNYGAIADQQQAEAAAAVERLAKRSEAAKRGAATRKAERAKRAQAIESGNQLRSRYEATVSQYKAIVRDNYEKLWQNELGPQLDNARNIRNERISGVRDRQRAAVAAGQNARIDAHLNREVAGWEQLGENSRKLNNARTALENRQSDYINNYTATKEKIRGNIDRQQQYYRDKAAAAIKAAGVTPNRFSAEEAQKAAKQEIDQYYNHGMGYYDEAAKETEQIQGALNFENNYRNAQGEALLRRYNEARQKSATSENPVVENPITQEKRDPVKIAQELSEAKLHNSMLDRAEELGEGFSLEDYEAGKAVFNARMQGIRSGKKQSGDNIFGNNQEGLSKEEADTIQKQLDQDIQRQKDLIAANDYVKEHGGLRVNTERLTNEALGSKAAVAAAAPVGSGETLGSSARSMLTTDKNGNLIMDVDAYRAADTSDMKTWGAGNAQQYDIDSLQRMVEKEREAINNAPEKLRQAKIKELDDKLRARAERGYGIGDWIFGNQLHTGAIGAAAIAGTMGVAFGGHKSNAELYASPF